MGTDSKSGERKREGGVEKILEETSRKKPSFSKKTCSGLSFIKIETPGISEQY